MDISRLCSVCELKMSSYILYPRSYHDQPPTPPPTLHPKTASITANIAAASRATHKPALPPTPELDRRDSEDYVATDVFRLDRQTQEEIDVSIQSLFTNLCYYLLMNSCFPPSPTTTRTQ